MAARASSSPKSWSEWESRSRFVNPLEPRAWRKALRKNTRALFLESPVNPTCRVLDMRSSLSTLAHAQGIALVVDSTFASPVNFRPIEHGADVVIHSATKYLNGHHDILCGVVCGNEPYIDEVRQKMMVWGQAPDPFACWLLERGLKTLDVRVKRQNENAMRDRRVVLHQTRDREGALSGTANHPDHEVAKNNDGRIRRNDGDRAQGRRRGGADRFIKQAQAVHARREPWRRGLAGHRAALQLARST